MFQVETPVVGREPRSLSRRAFLAGSVGLGLSALVGAGCREQPVVPLFDADRAYSDLVTQVRFGPRVPNTRPHEACRDWLRAELSRSLGTARLQPFRYEDAEVSLSMDNILAEHDPGNARQVLLAAHWDTRPTADRDPDPRKRHTPIPGANDGASGVAVLLEIARVIATRPPKVGVRIALFDGEDYGPGDDRMYMGAKRYSVELPSPAPQWGVLLDMVGDRDLGIWRERSSDRLARAVNDRVWSAARRAGHSDVFHDGVRWSITDDHLPLLAAGVPIVDLIDFDYPYWHTTEDTPDKCSAESLRAVGETLLRALYS